MILYKICSLRIFSLELKHLRHRRKFFFCVKRSTELKHSIPDALTKIFRDSISFSNHFLPFDDRCFWENTTNDNKDWVSRTHYSLSRAWSDGQTSFYPQTSPESNRVYTKLPWITLHLIVDVWCWKQCNGRQDLYQYWF